MTIRGMQVSSFCAPGAGGNHHTLCYDGEGCYEHGVDVKDLPPPLELTPNLILLSGSPDQLHAHFFNTGRPVKRCGSGNIAIAAFVYRYLRGEPECWALSTPIGEVTLGHDDVGPYYLDRPLRQTPLDEPDLWRGIIGAPFVDGCFCGGPGDYVLLEVSRPLERLSPRLRQLCLYSRRALIVYRRISSGQAELRYFAPQYGPGEDAATGSACVQIARYLWHRYRQSQCAFAQKSPEGGYIHTQLRSPLVVVRGRVTLYGRSTG